MRITIDRDVCIGSGNCVRIAEDVFDQDDEALAVLVNPAPAPERLADVRQVVEACPTSAIAIIEG